MFQQDLLALHLMRLLQHQQAYTGALADVRRCLDRPDTRTEFDDLLAEIEMRGAQLDALVERLRQLSDH
ncbi:hypothetical protein SOM59_02340 [Pseudomonas coleopterorum]|uniref:hypothetical protein n=1 Tax=Pseudomonas coleopterorum TaxID=1605838 RepID=UPI002A69E6FC|nr:hypothetical protein [Pseudomonas coleopterorum]MDY1015917.1 hypothetical protein [Pseudomonas coleopterorum]